MQRHNIFHRNAVLQYTRCQSKVTMGCMEDTSHYLYLADSAHYSEIIANSWASVSPTISNSTAPYPSSFSYTAPSGNLFWYELDVYNANWSATRNGGSSGLTATVSHF